MLIKTTSEAEAKMKSVLKEMQSSGELCNVVIKTGVRSTIKAHKCILAANLEYFRTSFRFAESKSEETSTIDLSHFNCKGKVVEKVVQSFYTNRIEVKGENLTDMLRVADYLMYYNLIVGIVEFMERTLEASTAVMYFQLCIKYRLDKETLFESICLLLAGRMHDYFIHQPTSLDWEMDVMEAMLKYNFFNQCTPLQIVKFTLQKVERLFCQAESHQKEELIAISLSIFSNLETIITSIDKSILNKWSASVSDYFNSWMASNSKQISNFEDIQARLGIIRNSELLKNNKTESQSNTTCTQNQNIFSDTPSSPSTSTSLTSDAFEHRNIESYSPALKESNPTIVPSTLHNTDESGCKSDKELFTCATSSGSQIAESDSTSNDTGDFLVVLAPSLEMLSDLFARKSDRASPQFSLYFYDIEFHLWKNAGTLDFPISGNMKEKHRWRMAFVNQSLFLFSVDTKKGLEYNIFSKKWLELGCEKIFEPLVSSVQDNDDCLRSSVIKIIPVSMPDSLVVLSMRGGVTKDHMMFSTQEHIHQWNPETRTFSHVACTVPDMSRRMREIKWTIDGNDLVTVRGSKLKRGDFPTYQIERIHVYNAKSKLLDTYHVDFLFKSPVRIFLQSKKLHLVSISNEHMVFNFVTREMEKGGKVFISNNFSREQLNFGSNSFYSEYPAEAAVFGQGGNSAWTLNSNFKVFSAVLSEVSITENEEFLLRHHPNPPFLYITAMCTARLDKRQFASLDQEMFQFPTIKKMFIPK